MTGSNANNDTGWDIPEVPHQTHHNTDGVFAVGKEVNAQNIHPSVEPRPATMPQHNISTPETSPSFIQHPANSTETVQPSNPNLEQPPNTWSDKPSQINEQPTAQKADQQPTSIQPTTQIAPNIIPFRADASSANSAEILSHQIPANPSAHDAAHMVKALTVLKKGNQQK